MTPTYTKNRRRDGQGSRFTYYYRCTKTYKHDWHSCRIKSINADKIEEFILNRLKELSQDERVIESLVRRINQKEEERLYPLKQQEKRLLKEIEEVEKKIKNLISVLAEGGARKFPSIKKELENLENKKKVLEFDLEGVRLSIQKERQERFEAKIVLDTLRNFVQKIETVSVEDRPRLFQYLIKDIIYGREEIEVNIFYLPSPEVIKTGSILSSKWLPLLNNFRTLHLKFENTIVRKN